MVANPVLVADAEIAAFEVLREEVAKLNEGSRVPTAAGLKSSLQRSDRGFDEKPLGYKRFIDFLQAAEAHGYVSVLRDTLGHPRIYPAGKATAVAKVAISESEAVAVGALRLRSDVWRAVIDWEENYTRAWDRKISRAFMYPADDESTPPWGKQPERFVQIVPISQETQIGWMKEFAESQASGAREALVVALAPGAPRGEFKRTLGIHHLEEAWSRALQAHAARFVQAWAASNSVSIKNLFDRPHEVARSTSESRVSEAVSVDLPRLHVDRLREELHRVIDRMSPEDLTSLRVPASYLIAE